MKRSLCLIVVCSLIALAPSELSAQAPPTSPEHPLKIGDKAPAFSLTSQQGQTATLANLLEKGPVAVVFFRSADW